MTIEIKIYVRNAQHAMDIVKELRDSGYVQGVDFDFAYHKPMYDGHWQEIIQRNTMFTFYKEELATWFSLKYH